MKNGALIIVVVALAVGCAPATAQQADVGAIAWLAGCWRAGSGPSVVEEQWMAPRAGVMLGMSRAVEGGHLSSTETVLLRERDGRLVYTVTPSAQATTDFTSTAVSDTEVVFENPAHDFPQRIVYRRVGADSLHARIDGPRDGRTRVFAFAYARAPCG